MSDAGFGDTEVLVAGAGPPGLVARITRARYGIDGLVIDRTDEISILSRALVMTTRSMELLRAWGLEDEVRTGAADVEPRRVGYADAGFGRRRRDSVGPANRGRGRSGEPDASGMGPSGPSRTDPGRPLARRIERQGAARLGAGPV
jgi:2-polyprenyl-6-methoxyphenol hydroxylase-like FAD-dependent oxidoreductase